MSLTAIESYLLSWISDMSASCNRVSVFRTRRSVARRFRAAMILSTRPSDTNPEQTGARCPVPHAAAIPVHPSESFQLTLGGNDEDTADAGAFDDGTRTARRGTVRFSGVAVHARPRAASARADDPVGSSRVRRYRPRRRLRDGHARDWGQ